MGSLAIPLTQAQIDAANRLHARLPQLQTSEAALMELAKRFPELSLESVLLNTVAVNSLYGTNVLATFRMAKHVKQILEKTDVSTAGWDLVENLAQLPPGDDEKKGRQFISFASKFAHFFINERFPIMDSYAVAMVNLHLGRHNHEKDSDYPYCAFVENLRELKALANLNLSGLDLDHYLWISGEYLAFQKDQSKAQISEDQSKVQISRELRTLFENPAGETRADLAILAPPALDKAFKAERKPFFQFLSFCRELIF